MRRNEVKRFFLFSGLLVLFCLMLSCKSSSTTPTPPAKSAPTVARVDVTSAHTTILVGATEQMTATVVMSDGTTKAGVGTWSSDTPAQATVDQSGVARGVTPGNANIIFNNTAGGQGHKLLTVRALWSAAGSGDTVFDMPTYVSRVKITGTYNRYSSNFIVYIAGHLVVNELLGTGWDSTYFEGTYVTNGGTVEIKYSSGVAWTFTEVAATSALGLPPMQRSVRPTPGNREYEIYKRVSDRRR